MSNTTYTYDEDCYSDLCKDAYGFRPSEAAWTAWAAMTPAEKQERWDYVVGVLKGTMAEEERREAGLIAIFEATVTATIANGAKDRETAIRWIIDAENVDGVDGDIDYFCYRMGLPYGYFATAGEAA
jgi:hypothetical protein